MWKSGLQFIDHSIVQYYLCLQLPGQYIEMLETMSKSHLSDTVYFGVQRSSFNFHVKSEYEKVFFSEKKITIIHASLAHHKEVWLPNKRDIPWISRLWILLE